jgi:hypothetical protein
MDVTQTPANSVKGNPLNQVAGKKRKGKTIFNVAYRQQANNITADEGPPDLATIARERRKRIRDMITEIDSSSNQHSNPVDPPNLVDKLSDPAVKYTLAFPFVGAAVPNRFKVGHTAEKEWDYVGRTKFKELLKELKFVRESDYHTTLWLYGTQGYGKSHLLGTLVCYLAAQDELVVYIPDYLQFLENPVEYMQTAMLFAWADDIAAQEKIMTLKTMDEIKDFFKSLKYKSRIIFVVGQTDALTTGESLPTEEATLWKVHEWFLACASTFIKVFSSSANYREFIEKSHTKSSRWVVPVYGGLTEVSYVKIYVTMRLLTRLDGNGTVVGAT